MRAPGVKRARISDRNGTRQEALAEPVRNTGRSAHGRPMAMSSAAIASVFDTCIDTLVLHELWA